MSGSDPERDRSVRDRAVTAGRVVRDTSVRRCGVTDSGDPVDIQTVEGLTNRVWNTPEGCYSRKTPAGGRTDRPRVNRSQKPLRNAKRNTPEGSYSVKTAVDRRTDRPTVRPGSTGFAQSAFCSSGGAGSKRATQWARKNSSGSVRCVAAEAQVVSAVGAQISLVQTLRNNAEFKLPKNSSGSVRFVAAEAQVVSAPLEKKIRLVRTLRNNAEFSLRCQ